MFFDATFNIMSSDKPIEFEFRYGGEDYTVKRYPDRLAVPDTVNGYTRDNLERIIKEYTYKLYDLLKPYHFPEEKLDAIVTALTSDDVPYLDVEVENELIQGLYDIPQIREVSDILKNAYKLLDVFDAVNDISDEEAKEMDGEEFDVEDEDWAEDEWQEE
jgi:hypothetical protein